MSTITTGQTKNLQMGINIQNEYVQHLSVLTMVKTMLEIIKIKNVNSMDEHTREQFPTIAKEIILLAEQTQ